MHEVLLDLTAGLTAVRFGFFTVFPSHIGIVLSVDTAVVRHTLVHLEGNRVGTLRVI